MDSSREQNIDKPAVCQKIENSIDLPNKDDNEEEKHLEHESQEKKLSHSSKKHSA